MRTQVENIWDSGKKSVISGKGDQICVFCVFVWFSFGVCCLLLLLVVCCLLFAVCCLWFVVAVCCLLFAVCCLPFAGCRLPVAGCCCCCCCSLRPLVRALLVVVVVVVVVLVVVVAAVAVAVLILKHLILAFQVRERSKHLKTQDLGSAINTIQSWLYKLYKCITSVHINKKSHFHVVVSHKISSAKRREDPNKKLTEKILPPRCRGFGRFKREAEKKILPAEKFVVAPRHGRERDSAANCSDPCLFWAPQAARTQGVGMIT